MAKTTREKFRRIPRPRPSKALKIHFYAIGAGINGIAPTPVFNPQNGKPVTDMFGNILYQNQRVHFNEAGLKEVAKIAMASSTARPTRKSLEQIFATSTSWKRRRCR